ncbi:SCO4848 family membrane protein [Streptomyces sp. NL15-2K]|uniref:SCO4848 family membrane protein n=1 Tax=Streptomyces sp. NL15-2K TaxID=376149 RepID=UPI0035B51F8C
MGRPSGGAVGALSVCDSLPASRPLGAAAVVVGSCVWITFVKNLIKDGSGLAFDDAGDPTAYFWVHLLLAVVSFVLGTVVGAIGLRGLRALRRTS